MFARINGYLRHSTSTGMQFDELDAFRGWACLGVVVLHALPHGILTASMRWDSMTLRYLVMFLCSGGFGVNLFFFLSGFMLFIGFGKSYYEGRPQPDKLAFWGRRFRRIAPAYYISLICVMLIWRFAYSGEYRIAFNPVDMLAHLLFIHNLSSQYSQSINIVLWTLAIEVQFYIILPFMANWFYGRRSLVSVPIILLLSAAIRVPLIDGYAYPGGVLPFASPPFNQLLFCLDQFVIGICFANIWLYMRYRKPGRYTLNGLPAIGIAVIGFTAFMFAFLMNFVSRNPMKWVGLMPLMSVGFGMAVLGVMSSPALKKLVASPMMQFFGIISYSVYLWHTQVAAFLDISLPSLAQPTLLEFFVRAAIIIPASTALSVLSYIAFERAFLKRSGPKAVLAAERPSAQ